MLLTHETTIVLNKNDANIVGHMYLCGLQALGMFAIMKETTTKIWDWRNILTGIIRSPQR